MKKIMMITLILALCLMCVYAPAEEEEREIFTCGDYQYILLDNGTVEITEYSGTDKELIIPNLLDGYAVTSIGDGAFYSCSELIDVTIPDSVTVIGEDVFSIAIA